MWTDSPETACIYSCRRALHREIHAKTVAMASAFLSFGVKHQADIQTSPNKHVLRTLLRKVHNFGAIRLQTYRHSENTYNTGGLDYYCQYRKVTMECIVANVDHMRFDIEIALDEQYGALSLPFTGMDKSIAAVCQFYPRGTCVKGASCPFRHVRGDRTIVCKHWLRGLCKKGDQCEFLHEYDMTKMPECYFYSRFNACHNKECPFLHIDPETKVRDCPWYDRGFCRHGPLCRHRHVRRVLCMAYLAGFCPDGPNCKFMHPRFELPAVQDMQPKEGKKVMITCHFCGEGGHKAIYCNKIPPDVREAQVRQEIEGNSHTSHHHMNMHNGPPPRGPQKPLEEVTCYKCGQKGHYANKCPKGHLAFLSHAGGGGGGSQSQNYRR